MTEEAIADSESFVEEGAQLIADDIFRNQPETKEEIVEEVVEEITEDSTEEQEESKEETVEIRSAPNSWKKEMHESWSSLSPDVQDYIELREQQMKEGIDVAKEDADTGRTIRDIMTPYRELLQSQNVNETDAVKYLMNAHYNLSNADEEGKIKLLNQMAQSYGVNLDGKKLTPEVQSLQQELQSLKQIVNQTQQVSLQEKQSKIMEEVEAFASKHEFFDDVAEDIVPFIHAGLSLQEAYEKAIWANPVTRQKEIDRIEKEKEENLEKEKQEKLEKAKKAKSTNVKSRDTNKAPTGPTGKMFDDMHELYDEIQNR